MIISGRLFQEKIIQGLHIHASNMHSSIKEYDARMQEEIMSSRYFKKQLYSSSAASSLVPGPSSISLSYAS